MGFYLRKSFRMGPMRLNLSKSGLGVSAGVRGARIGVSSRGKAYIHAGRGGLYFRETLGGPAARGHRSEPDVIYEETGVTFAPDPHSAAPATDRIGDLIRRRKKAAVIYLLLPALGVVLVGIAAESLTGSLEQTLLVIGGIALLVAWVPPAVRAVLTNWRGTRFGKVLAAALVDPDNMDEGRLGSIEMLLLDGHVTAADKTYFKKMAYLHLIKEIVADRRISDVEQRVLTKTEELFALGSDFYRDARAEGYKEVYLEAIADHELTQDEEAQLAHIQAGLSISDGAIADELDFVDRLRDLRELRKGTLPAITPSKPLPKTEICHCEVDARVLKEKILRSYQSEGRKFKVRGLVVDKEGTLFVTNKRMLIVHSGTTTIRHDKILDLEVDDDRSLLTITKDGARTPIMITTPDALRVAAVIAGAAGI